MPIFDDPRMLGGLSSVMQMPTSTVKKKPAPVPPDPAMAPMIGDTSQGDSFNSMRQGLPGSSTFPTLPQQGPPKPMTFGDFGAHGPPAPAPGLARAWSSQGPAQASTPVQEFQVPVGPQPNHGRMPDPIGHAGKYSWEGGSGGGGGSTTAADSISRFYAQLGIPLSGVVNGAQRDEELAKHMATQRFGSEQGTVGLQQAAMQHGLQSAPQNELVKRIAELSTANLYNPTPQGSALIKHYMDQLQGMSGGAPTGPVAGSGEQQEGSVPGSTPTKAPMTNNHPGFMGDVHAAIHSAIPSTFSGLAGTLASKLPLPIWAKIPAVLAASLGTYHGGNALMDKVDPSGIEASAEHPNVSAASQILGGFAGYGLGKGRPTGQGTTAPQGPAGSLAAEAAGTPTTQNMAARQAQAEFGSEYSRPSRQMSPFGGGEVPPGQQPVAPVSRQLGMGELGSQGAAPRTSVTSANTPSQEPGQVAPFAPPKVQMSGDPQVDAALAAFKASGNATPSNIIPMPQQQQTSPAPGMRSTAMPSANATQAPIATNPVQMPQQPSGVQTLNPSMLTPEMLQRLIGDPRFGPAITHDPALAALIQKYLNSPAQ